jgi:signal transduction histidine kinase
VSLRAKLLGLFAALALAPLVALGVFDYLRSKSAVRHLIGDQTSIIANRTAEQLSQKFEIIDGDLRLLAGNTEAMRLLAEVRKEEGASRAQATDSARAYLNDAWRVLGANYDWVELRDAKGNALLHSGRRPSELDGVTNDFVVPVTVTVSDQTGPLGSLIGAVRVDAIVSPSMVETRFGRGGYTQIARDDGRTLIESNRPEPAHPPLLRSAGTFTYTERDTQRVATVATVRGAPLLVVSAGAVPEFAPSLARVSVINLVFALTAAAILGGVFLVITRRVTKPLETLTDAATQVGQGNFSPTLPPSGQDEVGRLTTAFAAMSSHIDRMVAELETSRHMAAVGSFARQIAHEIRNPLTSIKLNLQGLERDAREGIVGEESPRMLELCLEEITRLDRVVRGVLTLGRPANGARRDLSLAAVLSRAIDVVRPQLREQQVDVDVTGCDHALAIHGDEEQLVAMFLNLFVNAAEAMPRGGRLTISMSATPENGSGPMARVTISDTGPGVPIEARRRVFDPFFTTKPDGSGLGLAVALRDAEQHGGKLTLDEAARGASFVVELPIVVPTGRP